MTNSNPHTTRTVVVLGCAYGGVGGVGPLARRLPEGWRLVVIDRQSHANHVYPFPRFTVLPQHAAKSFIPRNKLFTHGRVMDTQGNVAEKDRTGAPLPAENPNPVPCWLVHGIITDLTPNAVTVLTANADGNFDDVKDDGSNAPADRIETIGFDYCIHALGGTLSEPSDIWGDVEAGRKQLAGRGTKTGGIAALTRYNEAIQQAENIVVVGGGALGIQFATDIKEVFPNKSVTLLHSRDRLMPIYAQGLHDAIAERCEALGVRLILGERVLKWPENPQVVDGKTKVVKTSKGTEIAGDLVLVCTGTKPTVKFMKKIDDGTIASNGCVRVKDTLQIRTESETRTGSFDHMFAVGDCADTTAIRAGHMAFAMGGLAGRNVLRLIDAREKNETPELEIYDPAEPLIKVSLGLKHACVAGPKEVVNSADGAEDIHARGMWALLGAQDLGDDE